MDTRFWGPSGWKFLHLLLELAPENLENDDKLLYSDFMNNISNILPCKFCRISFAKYTTSTPISKYISTRTKLTYWLYLIHNKVNNKLRKQGYCTYPNPNYDRIREFYTILATSITNPIKTLLELANDFIGSIIINYSAYVYNNPTLIPTINGYYYSMFRLLAQLLINIIQRTPRFRDDTRELSRKLHTFFKTNMIRLSDSGDDHAKLIEWYYDVICLVNSQYCASKLKVFIRHFEPYIIDTCNMNYAKRTGNINSCRNKRSLKRAGILHHKILKTH